MSCSLTLGSQVCEDRCRRVSVPEENIVQPLWHRLWCSMTAVKARCMNEMKTFKEDEVILRRLLVKAKMALSCLLFRRQQRS